MAIKNRFDFTNWLARSSTWLGILAASSAGGLVFYATMPERVQNLMPDWTLLALGGIGMACGIATPIATSFKQRNLGRATQVIVTQEVKVQGDITAQDATRIAESQVQPANEAS